MDCNTHTEPRYEYCLSHPGAPTPWPCRSIYVSGLPGTGKSFTVQRAIDALREGGSGAPARTEADVLTVTVNCMALRDTKDVYAVLLAECAIAIQSSMGEEKWNT